MSMSSALSESFISWTVPDRRIGTRELLPIPTEIYIEIIAYFDPLGLGICLDHKSHQSSLESYKRDVQNLGLVCRFFHSLTLPLLFRTIRVRLNYDISRGQWNASKTTFLQALSEGKDLGALSAGTYVQEYSLEDSLLEWKPSPITEHLDDVYGSALVNMPNVETFRIRTPELSSILLNNVSRLSNLTSLTFEVRSMSKLSSSDILTLTSGIKLQSLKLMVAASREEHSGDFSMTNLVPLAANSHLTELTVGSWSFLQCLMASEVVPPLKTLIMHNVRDPIALYNSYLTRIPTLVELQLYIWPWISNREFYHPISSKFPLSILKNLRHLSCTWDLAYFFTGPHLLESITFTPGQVDRVRGTSMLMETVNETVCTLNLPKKLIKKLEAAGWSSNAGQWLPNLQKLAVRMAPEIGRKHFDVFFKGFIDSWGAQDTLTNLRFYLYWDSSEEKQCDKAEIDAWFEDMTTTLKVEENYPNLSRLEIFCSDFGGCWIRDEPGIWQQLEENYCRECLRRDF